MTEEHNDIEDKPKNFFSRLTSALRGKKDVLKNNLVNNLPANAINKFIFENKNKLKVICVNNTQIFFKKMTN